MPPYITRCLELIFLGGLHHLWLCGLHGKLLPWIIHSNNNLILFLRSASSSPNLQFTGFLDDVCRLILHNTASFLKKAKSQIGILFLHQVELFRERKRLGIGATCRSLQFWSWFSLLFLFFFFSQFLLGIASFHIYFFFLQGLAPTEIPRFKIKLKLII